MLGVRRTDEPCKAPAMPVVARQAAGAAVREPKPLDRLSDPPWGPGIVAGARGKPIATGLSDCHRTCRQFVDIEDLTQECDKSTEVRKHNKVVCVSRLVQIV